MEIVTLIGIIITLLTTIAGWFFTHRAQLEILTAQTDYQHHKEQQKILVGDNLAFIKELQVWFEKGRKIYLNAVAMPPLEIDKAEAEGFDEKERIKIISKMASRFEDVKHIVAELSELRAAEPRLFYLAKIYDPLASQSKDWKWGDPNTPNDLPQIIDNFENEVLDQVNEMLYGETGRTLPKIDDQFHALHESGIQAMERIKAYVVFQEIEKGVKK